MECTATSEKNEVAGAVTGGTKQFRKLGPRSMNAMRDGEVFVLVSSYLNGPRSCYSKMYPDAPRGRFAFAHEFQVAADLKGQEKNEL